MTIVQAALLGILQGLTEFLPISSSGHLVIAQSIMPSFTQPGVLLDVTLHAGTLFAVFLYFRKGLIELDRHYMLLLFVGSIPAVVFGLLLSNFIESLFSLTWVVGAALLVTSLANYLTDKTKKKKEKLTIPDSFLIGIAQAVAIIPGISRSGLTIFTATRIGVERKKAAEFSFLLSLPVILGASILQLTKYHTLLNANFEVYLIGFVFSLIVGFIAIKVVLKLLITKNFKYFAVYCAIVGVLTLLLQ